MLKKVLFFIAVVIIFFAIFDAIFHNKNQQVTVTIDNKVYTVDTANTPAEQEQGLSGRSPLQNGTGMLFIFDTPDNYGFWMKEMNFPLDIIWISADYHIVHIEKDLTPQTYPTVYYPNSPSQYVLEISAGQTDQNNIKVGDLVTFSKNKF